MQTSREEPFVGGWRYVLDMFETFVSLARVNEISV